MADSNQGKPPVKSADKPAPKIAKPAEAAKALPPVALDVAVTPAKPKVVAKPAPAVVPAPVAAAKVEPAVAKVAEAPKPAPAPTPKVEASKVEAKPAITPPPAPVAAPAPVVAKPALVAAKPVPAPVPTKPVAKAAPVSLETPPASLGMLKKGLSIMTDTTAFTASTEKAQAMFGDFNSRAKAATEKGAKLVEELSELTKGNIEAMVASGKIAAKGAEDLGAEYAAYGKSSLEKASGAFKSFTSVKSPTELFQLQSDFAKSSFDAMVAESSKLTESFVKIANDVMQPLSSRFAVAAEKVKAAAL